MRDDRSHLLHTTAAYERFANEYAGGKDDRAWLRPLIAHLQQLLPPRALVADLGCGPGRETVELRAGGWRVVGLDIAAAFLDIAQTTYPADGYVRGDLLHLPFAARSLDGAWAAASLLHLTSDEVGSALAEVRRVLRPGGALYCSMQIGSTAGMVPATVHETVRQERYYTYYEPAAWRDRLERAGFQIVSFEATELSPSVAAISCNAGARGWINAFARAPA